MDNLLQGSILMRVLRRIGAFLSGLFRGSALLTGLGRALRWCFAGRAIVYGLDYGDGPVQHSGIAAAEAGLSRRLAGMHRLGECGKSSLLYRIFTAILRTGRESRLLGWLFRDGMTGVLLTVLGLYGILDWALRDLLAVPVLSSVWDELLLIFCFAYLVWKRVDRKETSRPRITALGFCIFIFLAVGVFLVGKVSPFFSIAVSGYRAECQYILWFYVVLRLLRDERDFRRLYLTLLAGAALIGLHGIYQFIVAVPIPASWTDAAEKSVRTRVFSIVGSPNIMAAFTVLFAPMGAGLAYAAKDARVKLGAWFITFCLCFSCLFTMSRGGWLAMAAAVLIFALLVDRRLFLLMLAAAICAMFLPFVRSRIGYLATEDFMKATTKDGRAARWVMGMDYLRNSDPMFGFGLGMFGGAVAMQHKVYFTVSYFYLDNYYLKTLVEMGYVGLSAFILMLVSLVCTGLRTLRRTALAAPKQENRLYPLCAGLFSGMCGVMVHLYLENIFEEPYMLAYFWILAAMMVWLGFYCKAKDVMKG